jgi:hypothetical protein
VIRWRYCHAWTTSCQPRTKGRCLPVFTIDGNEAKGTEEAREMKKNTTFAAIAASVMAAFTIGLAAPAVAAPITGPGDDQVTVDNSQYPVNGQTPYGTYQNPHKSR